MEKTIYSKEYIAEVPPFDKRNFIFQTLLIDNDLIDFKYIKEENPYPNINDINILLPTMNSRIIKCDYRIQVSLYFDNFVTAGYRPRVKLPIIITHLIEDGNNNINNNINNNYNLESFKNNNNINESSLIFDKNYQNYNNGNNSINSKINLGIGSINETENENLNNDLTEYIISNKVKNQNTSEDDKSNNKKPNYVELKKEEFYYNINEI